MKTILFAFALIITAVSSSAYADIICQSSNPNQLSVYIKVGPSIKTGFEEHTFPAEVTLQGLRLYYKINTKMVTGAYKTRLGVGSQSKINLGSNYYIGLEDITWAPVGYEYLLGFTGVYGNSSGNTAVKLKCAATHKQ